MSLHWLDNNYENMIYKYILLVALLFSFSSFALANLEDEVAQREWEIWELTQNIENRTWEYEIEVQLLERKFIIERQRELSDCSEREVSCIISQAEKKYVPLFDDLKKEYETSIKDWQESVSELRDEIRSLRQAELDKQQRILNETTSTNFVPWFGEDVFSKEDEEKIWEIQDKIAASLVWKQSVIDTYDQNLKDLEDKFTIERQSELDDCARRSISCTSSFAKRKYEPLYEQLEQQYFKDVFVWTEAIRELEEKIQDIKNQQAEKTQQLISSRTKEEIKQDELVQSLIEQSELDFEKAEGYFKNKSYNNAAIFYAKSCNNEYAQLFLCYNWLAWSHENLNEFQPALDAYKLALENSYTQEDAADIQKSIDRLSSRIALSSRLSSALDDFMLKIDERFKWKELILKRRFYDDLIIKITKKRKDIQQESTLLLFDIAIDAFRDARKKIDQEVNDLYN